MTLTQHLNLFDFTFNIRFFISLISLVFINCIDPSPPEFKFIEGLVFVDGFASNIEGASYVKIRKSSYENSDYKTIFFSGCSVELISEEKVLILTEGFDSYVVPSGFKVNSGEEWKLTITFPDGTKYWSSIESFSEEILIENIKSEYDLKLLYDNKANKYRPGHRVMISFNDPVEKENYFYFDYKTYEMDSYCSICFNGVLRNGKCIPTTNYRRARDYYTYPCNTECFKIRYNENISIYNDEFTNGEMVSDLVIGKIPLYSKRDILVQVQQYNISFEAYKYYKSLKDVVENNNGLNAPLPSVMIGNLYNPDDENEIVLGRFTVASGSNKSIYIPRSSLEGYAYGSEEVNIFEYFGENVPMPLTRFDYPIFSSCEDGPFRSSTRPSEWKSN